MDVCIGFEEAARGVNRRSKDTDKCKVLFPIDVHCTLFRFKRSGNGITIRFRISTGLFAFSICQIKKKEEEGKGKNDRSKSRMNFDVEFTWPIVWKKKRKKERADVNRAASSS